MLRVINNVAEYSKLIDQLADDSIGFVPTMGNLHQGHLKLLEASLKENNTSVISIFVNPTQFGQGEDFEHYPRTKESDISKVESLFNQFTDKNLVIFIPESPQEIYNDTIESNYLELELHKELEGALRPTHFQGVEQVVEILFKIINPRRAYFGKKDYQQYKLIELLVNRLRLNITIVGIDIVREKSGLAMSSRNQYLNAQQLEQAAIISKELRNLKNNFEEGKDLIALESQIQKILINNKNFNYIEARNAKDLSKEFSNNDHIVILANYKMENINLLDNIELNK